MNAITISNVSKHFRIPHEKKHTILQNIMAIVKRRMSYEEFWALKDISFEVAHGESLGIIGPNGSGKSTLLKLLAGVLYPDGGKLEVNGKISSLLELGVGFQTELSAKDNVYLYSTILGVSKKDTRKRYDDIFEFAELRKFENMRLKNFSSGMYLRLAFATAVHADPGILLVDEAFAVGDEAFQKKCVDKINQFRHEGKTILFVSHNMKSVKELCARCLLLRQGKQIYFGNTDEAIKLYQAPPKPAA